RRGEGNALWNWADELYKLGDKAGAIEKATAAVAIMEEIEDPDAAKCHGRLKEWKAGGD
ncbi:MAG: hypothetical protein IIC55_08285, partial [Proteobacteria bacterium]|nr:hypothetical protein [Pseudomonadota bacterium]